MQVLKGPKNSPRIWCLVDSGADFIQLDKSFANTAGIVLGAGVTRSIQTASGGSVPVDELQNIDFDVEGTSVKDTCLFGTNSISILGRVTFLRAFDVGFDKKVGCGLEKLLRLQSHKPHSVKSSKEAAPELVAHRRLSLV